MIVVARARGHDDPANEVVVLVLVLGPSEQFDLGFPRF